MTHFSSNVPFLYLPKTSENLDIFRGYRNEKFGLNGLTSVYNVKIEKRKKNRVFFVVNEA